MKLQKYSSYLVSLTLISVASTASITVHASGMTSFTLTDIGNLGGQSFGFDINDSGEIVGQAVLPDGKINAFYWSQANGLTNLGTLTGDDNSAAVSINNNGQITGFSQNFQHGGPAHGFLWQSDSGMLNIGSSTNLSFVNAISINQQGQIAGDSNVGGFIYSTTSGITQPVIPNSVVAAIETFNDHGQIVFPDSNGAGIYFYSPGQSPIRIQSNPQITAATAEAMNEKGTVVGSLNTDHAYIWNQTEGLTDITPGENNFSSASDINNLGQVVGSASLNGGPTFPFLFDDGSLYDLTALLGPNGSGWADIFPKAINDNGQITGYGTFDGQSEAFLLNPTTGNITPNQISTPEPTTLSLLALAALPLLTRRRRH